MLWSCTLALALGAANPHLETADGLVQNLRYSDAVAALVKARAVTGNDRSTFTAILWLQGMVAASLGKPDEARTFFRTLCSIDPDYSVKTDLSPKVMGPFYEAKGWATTNGRIKFETLPPEVTDGHVTAVAVALTNDPLKLARRIRFHLQSNGSLWYTVDAALEAPRATIAWQAYELSWWAELLGENDAVLELAGSATAPIVVRTKKEDALPPPPPPPVLAETSRSLSRPFFGPMRYAGAAAVGVGLAAVIGGAICGTISAGQMGQLKNPTRDSTGAITSLTQRQAFALDDAADSNATAAMGMFVSSGILAVGGGALLVFGNPGDP